MVISWLFLQLYSFVKGVCFALHAYGPFSLEAGLIVDLAWNQANFGLETGLETQRTAL